MITRQILAGITALAATLAILVWGTVSLAASKTVIPATTTSTQDSGLPDVLVPLFEKESGFQVKTISVGSGQAMKMGEKGEADVLLEIIGRFGVDKFGTPLLFTDAGKKPELTGL